MTPSEISPRSRILARIRAALDKPAAHHSAEAARELFPAVADPLERFRRECAENNTECLLVADWEAGAHELAAILEALPGGEIFFQDAPLVRQLMPRVGLATAPERDESGHARRHAARWSSGGGAGESSQATVTLAEALVADTGSLFVSSACGGRAATVVAPVHIVLAEVGQLAPNLETAFARLRRSGADRVNSMLCLITGSSRTADIEKILVMGAHGPRRLVVVLSMQPA
jgi:L-lactate utilization protein LutC